jgi:hypothetical protein
MSEPVLQNLNAALVAKDVNLFLALCKEHKVHDLGLLMVKRLSTTATDDGARDALDAYTATFSDDGMCDNGNPIRTVRLLCNWCSSEQLTALWWKMAKRFPDGSYGWDDGDGTDRLVLVQGDADLDVVINGTRDRHDPSKALFIQMEPVLFIDPSPYASKWVHSVSFNNIEWHLSKTYAELSIEPVYKTRGSALSMIMSGKDKDEGQKKRLAFAQRLCTDENIATHAYGTAPFATWGKLPDHCKDNGLFPYKYHFNAENTRLPYYVTEKLIDAILAETLCFYRGAPNAGEWIDPRAFIALDLEDFERDAEIVACAIANGEWEKRIDVIRAEKRRILNELQFFPRLYNATRA